MPLKNQLRIDNLLSNISVRYKNAEYIAERAFPIVTVNKDTDKYRVYDRNFRIPEVSRADGGKSREHYFESSFEQYALKWHSLKDYVSDEAMDNYDAADLRADTTEELTDTIMRKVEKDFCDLFTTTNWSQNHSLTAALAWTNQTTSANPIQDMDTAASVVIRNSGFKPNMAILGRDGYIAAKNNINVLDRVKYTSAEIGEAMLASLFDVAELMVSHAQLDTSAEGQTEVIGQMWPDSAFLGYKAPRPSPKAPSCGYHFLKSKPAVKRWRDEEREAEAIEVNRKIDTKIVASLAGYLVKDVV